MTGWTEDVLTCLRLIGRPDFTLSDVYAWERTLAQRHKKNKNVRAKIRQQLQVLRDEGVLEFVGKAQYHLKEAKP